MNAFITGSREYGTPRDGSDIDLVIRVDPGTARRLRSLGEVCGDEGSRAVRFGSLNLLLCETDAQYAAWLCGTIRLKRKIEKCSRDEAIALFREIRKELGVEYTGESDEVKVDQVKIPVKKPAPDCQRSTHDLSELLDTL